MSIFRTLKEKLGVGEFTTFSAAREAKEAGSPIIVKIAGLTFRIQAGDFSRALAGVGEPVKAECLGDTNGPPKAV